MATTRPRELFARPRRRPHGHLRAGRHRAHLCFRDLRHRPDLAQRIDAKQRRAGRERRAFAHAELGDHAVRRRVDSRRSAVVLRSVSSSRIAASGTPSTTSRWRAAAARISAPRGRGRIEQREVFFLCGEPGRRHHVDQRLAATHRRERRLHVQVARHSRRLAPARDRAAPRRRRPCRPRKAASRVDPLDLAERVCPGSAQRWRSR